MYTLFGSAPKSALRSQMVNWICFSSCHIWVQISRQPWVTLTQLWTTRPIYVYVHVWCSADMCCLFSCTLQGAPESIIDRCNSIRVGSKKQPLTPKIKQQILELVKQYGTGVYPSVNVQTLADSVEIMFAVFYVRVSCIIMLHPQ